MNKFFLRLSLAALVLTPGFIAGQGVGLPGDSRKFRLSPVSKVSSPDNPTMDGRRFTVNQLIDGHCPRTDGAPLGRLGIR